MANPKHLKILNKGVEAWNKWRKENPEAKPYLSEANLQKANLQGADLGGADLREANLKRVNLREADLNNADLRRANLIEADLMKVNLSGASLTDTNLMRADLTRADFTEADLVGADLSGAILTNAELLKADLTAAKITKANLTGAHLGAAILGGAKLTDANLTRAYLIGTDLIGAFLMGANLMEANLMGANQTKANLMEANFMGASIMGTNYSGANLKDAIFVNTDISYCLFGDVDLSEVKGLDKVQHTGPSTIGIDTIYKSKGKIPEVFLRGCGVSEGLIKSIPDLLRYKDEYHSCFISFSFKDEEFVRKLFTDLQEKGIRCWYAPKDIESGKKIHEQLETAIGERDRLLLILSDASMTSTWVKTEISNARQREKKQNQSILHPIRLVPFEKIENWKQFDADIGDDTAKEIREYYIPDFSNWRDPESYKEAIEKLLDDLRVKE